MVEITKVKVYDLKESVIACRNAMKLTPPEYTDEEFCAALETYRNQDITKSIFSKNPLVRMFAILDRRIGKRTLVKIKETLNEQPDWLKKIYQLRLDAEKV